MKALEEVMVKVRPFSQSVVFAKVGRETKGSL